MNRLVVRHDGKRQFDLRDVDGVTGPTRSSKRDDHTQIGRFGVGFQSVYAVTTAPEVRSGPFHFQIEESVVPVPVERTDVSEDDGWTEFVLRFNHPARSPEKVRELIIQEFDEIGANALLFLENVKALRWTYDHVSGGAERKKKRIEGVPGATRVRIRTQDGEAATYFRYSRSSSAGKGVRSTSVAFALQQRGRAGYEVVAESPARTHLSVHFPTSRPTGFRFRVNAPFKTTVNREEVPFEPGDENWDLLLELASTTRESLGALKKSGYLSTTAIDLLPLEPSLADDPVYDCVREEVVAALRSDGLLPTAGGGHAKAWEGALPASQEIAALLTHDDLHQLFGRRRWLHPDLDSSSASALLTRTLGVPPDRRTPPP